MYRRVSKSGETIVDFDEAGRILHGRTLGTRDVMSFEADFVDRIERAFHEAVDDYIEQRTETGESRTSHFRADRSCGWHRPCIE